MALGDGLVKIKECIDVMKSVGYTGAISVETEGGDDFDQIVDLAAKSYQYLNNLING